MKYEEAIKIIDAHDQQSDFWSTVRTAVEKQIPKKFVLKTTKMGISTWGCPKCGSAIVPHPNVTWCDWCGQKIDMHEEVE